MIILTRRWANLNSSELIEKLERLKTGLISASTDGSFNSQEYTELRNLVISSPLLKNHVPSDLKSCRNPREYRRNIQAQYSHYADRRRSISEDINALISIIEDNDTGLYSNNESLIFSKQSFPYFISINLRVSSEISTSTLYVAIKKTSHEE